jgi:hypothetical protein
MDRRGRIPSLHAGAQLLLLCFARSWDLYISDAHYGSLGYEGYHDWEILQGRYILCLLFEYAATLGIVDVAYDSPVNARDDYDKLWGTDELWFLSRYDGLCEFRPTKLITSSFNFIKTEHFVTSDQKTKHTSALVSLIAL